MFVLEIDTDTKTGRPAVEQVPVMEALLVVTSKIVEQLLIPVGQIVEKIIPIPAQREPAALITPIPLLLRIIVVKEAVLSILVPAPLHLTMPEALTSATRKATFIAAMG